MHRAYPAAGWDDYVAPVCTFGAMLVPPEPENSGCGPAVPTGPRSLRFPGGLVGRRPSDSELFPGLSKCTQTSFQPLTGNSRYGHPGTAISAGTCSVLPIRITTAPARKGTSIPSPNRSGAAALRRQLPHPFQSTVEMEPFVRDIAEHRPVSSADLFGVRILAAEIDDMDILSREVL